jgi:hypothetical protein
MLARKMLDQVSIAAPCPADWESMPGTDQVRHCGQCDKNVYNLSAMTRRQAEALLLETEGRLCVQLYRRADGTILTENCPAGVRAIGRRISRVAGAAMSAVATLASATAAQFPMFPLPSELLESRSVISGIVKDATGQGVANAEVVVSQPGSELKPATTTDSDGHFRIKSLRLGSYALRVQAGGFSTFTKQVVLRPLQEYKIDATLQIGALGAAVAVDYAK